MLFTDPFFIFVFLPGTLCLSILANRFLGRTAAFVVLVAASLVFYAWWHPPYLILLISSICVNYFLGVSICANKSKNLFIAGVGFNLLLICVFKYTGFFTITVNQLSGLGLPVPEIALPLAISFFTFQQIAYLADTYAGKVDDTSFTHYFLFVTFFPQLIAGPIVHHKDVIPQFLQTHALRVHLKGLIVGAAIFIVGLYKKVVLADGMAPFADRVFDNASSGTTFIDAWGGAIAFGFQIYFDFSAYSDMAIGLALMFGIRLPLNFNSPYRATSIIDFWARWHITLSRFLRDYLYIPLGGNRHGSFRRYGNLMIVMLLGGLWHGAAWTFVIWGMLHGLYLVIAHSFRAARKRMTTQVQAPGPAIEWASRLMTFIAVTFAWVFFRADNWADALSIVQGMAGFNGWGVEAVMPFVESGTETGGGLLPAKAFVWMGLLFGVVWLLPNTQELIGSVATGKDSRFNADAIAPSKLAMALRSVATSARTNVVALLGLFCLVLSGTALLVVIANSSALTPFVYMVF